MKRIILIMLLVLAVNVEASGLSRLRKIYETSEQKIEKETEAEILAVGQKYVAALNQMKQTCKQKGDVQGIIALNKEIGRFATNQTIQATGTVHIAKAQKYALPLIEKVKVDRYKKLETLLATYKKALEKELKRLTMAEKIEEALEVETELKRINFVKADVETKIPEPEDKNKWISKDATYTVSSWYHNPLPSLLTCEGRMHGGNDDKFAFHTEGTGQDYIIIDLRRLSLVTGIQIWNRTHPKAGPRARTLTMWTSMTQEFKDEPVWKAQELQDVWDVELEKPVKARYVKLGLTDRAPFHLKQVKIFGESKGRIMSASSSRSTTTAKSLRPSKPIKRLLK